MCCVCLQNSIPSTESPRLVYFLSTFIIVGMYCDSSYYSIHKEYTYSSHIGICTHVFVTYTHANMCTCVVEYK